MTDFGDCLSVPVQERYGIKHVIGKSVTGEELTTLVREVLDKQELR